jgi:Ca2+:H+ antiporter
VIETALIVSVMIAAPAEKAGLARDTVFAAVMIVCNGIVGSCLLWGGARHHEQGFQVQGASTALAVLVALTSLTLISKLCGKPTRRALQHAAARFCRACIAGALRLIRFYPDRAAPRDYFLPVQTDDEEAHAPPPTDRAAVLSAGLLLLSLVAVVGLAKILTPTVEFGIAYLGVPKAVVGIIIATLVLLPEGLAAVRAARNNRLQV